MIKITRVSVYLMVAYIVIAISLGYIFPHMDWAGGLGYLFPFYAIMVVLATNGVRRYNEKKKRASNS